MNKFEFRSYGFDTDTSVARFEYGFEDGRQFVETIMFSAGEDYDKNVLNRAIEMAFFLVGTSYYKTFPSVEVDLGDFKIDQWQADFLNHVYQNGLGQFAFENGLKKEDLAHFVPNTKQVHSRDLTYTGIGTLTLQSGGKDSLLTASLLDVLGDQFVSWYVSNSQYHPALLDNVGSKLATSIRTIDLQGLKDASLEGAKNGHIPVTYVVQSLAIIQSILLGKINVLTSIAHEGEEPHHYIGDLAVTHQWSKTWQAEQDFAEYVSRYVSPDIKIGSGLRCYSELRVSELFIKYAWDKYGHLFSSCNVANYRQGEDNSVLHWCGNCPKCANSYLLFAPFLDSNELKSIFDGQDLFEKPSLTDTFKGLLAIEGFSKPFECIGEVDELRKAYEMAQARGNYKQLSFDVPKSNFDYMKTYPAQDWAVKMLE